MTKPDASKLLRDPTIRWPEEFMTELSGITPRWVVSGERPRPWFRGLPRVSFALEPSLLRYRHPDRNLRATESNLLNQFRLLGSQLLRDANLDPLQLMTVMQHHGVPTRLLDWTENALAALYFAVREHEYFEGCDDDAVVWVMNPIELSELRRNQRGIPFSSPDLLHPSVDSLLPLPFYPIHSTSRLTTQRGTFTLHSLNDEHSLLRLALNQLEETGTSFLWGIRIASDNRRMLRQALVEALGVGEFTVFPDLDGLARELRMLEKLEGLG